MTTRNPERMDLGDGVVLEPIDWSDPRPLEALVVGSAALHGLQWAAEAILRRRNPSGMGQAAKGSRTDPNPIAGLRSSLNAGDALELWHGEELGAADVLAVYDLEAVRRLRPSLFGGQGWTRVGRVGAWLQVCGPLDEYTPASCQAGNGEIVAPDWGGLPHLVGAEETCRCCLNPLCT